MKLYDINETVLTTLPPEIQVAILKSNSIEEIIVEIVFVALIVTIIIAT